MEPKKRLRMMEQYNETARHYDFRYRNLQFTKLALLYSRLAPPHGIILDYGAGTGLLWEFYRFTQAATQCNKLAAALKSPFTFFDDDMEWVHNQVRDETDEQPNTPAPNLNNSPLPNYRFVGLDISFEMLRIFLSKTESAKDRAHLESPTLSQLICADGQHLPFRDGVFTSVLAITALQNLENMEDGIDDINRVLEVDGEIGFTILKKGYPKDTLKFLFRSLGYTIIIPPYLGSDEIITEDWIGHVQKEIC